jgi:hypothetical protein
VFGGWVSVQKENNQAKTPKGKSVDKGKENSNTE